MNTPVVTVPDERWLGLWPAGEEPVDAHVWDMTTPTALEPVFVVLPYMGATAVLPRLAEVPSLRVVQTLSAGYENVLPHVPDGVTLATATGVHDASTAELAVALAIAALRGIPDFVRAAEHGSGPAGRARHWPTGGCSSSATADGRRSSGCSRRSRSRYADGPSRPRRREARPRRRELASLLPQPEVVVLAMPMTDETRGLVDAGFLAAMPDGALVVNVSRGPVVVTDELVAEV